MKVAVAENNLLQNRETRNKCERRLKLLLNLCKDSCREGKKQPPALLHITKIENKPDPFFSLSSFNGFGLVNAVETQPLRLSSSLLLR